MSSDLYRSEAIEAQELGHLGTVRLNPSPAWFWVSVVILGLLVMLAGILGTTEYARRLPVTGHIDESNARQIFATEFSEVSKLLVYEGQAVRKGETIALLSRTAIRRISRVVNAEQTKQLAHWQQIAAARSASFLQEKTRLAIAVQQTRELMALAARDTRIQMQKMQQLQLQFQRMSDPEAAGHVSHFERLRFKTSQLAEQQQLNDHRRTGVQLRRQLLELESALSDVTHRQQRELADIEIRLSEIRSVAAGNDPRMVVAAPVNGTVSRILVEAGSALKPGEPILYISTGKHTWSGTLEIPSHAAGHLQPGDPLWLEVDAYSGNRHGRIAAEVVHLSQHRIDKSSFHARLLITPPGREDLVLMPGMRFTTHVTLERRRLFDWALKPVLDLLTIS
jgi:membrane fusion protein